MAHATTVRSTGRAPRAAEAGPHRPGGGRRSAARRDASTCQHLRMDADYWSVEAILAESQRLPCTFGVDVPGLGYLEESGEVDVRKTLTQMHKHTRVELVYWMAHMLAV